MQFEWDEKKNESNLSKHGISFEEAKQIFDGILLTRIDDRKDYGETRFISIGMLGESIIILVAHTDRNGITRLISARKANERERTIYHDHINRAHERD